MCRIDINKQKQRSECVERSKDCVDDILALSGISSKHINIDIPMTQCYSNKNAFKKSIQKTISGNYSIPIYIINGSNNCIINREKAN